MSFGYLRAGIAAAALLGIAAAPASAQRQPTPEQRITALQQQLAASQSYAVRLEQRLDAFERQLQQIVNRSEENGHRLQVLESSVQQVRAEQDGRLTALETAAAAARAEASAQPPESAAVEAEPLKPVATAAARPAAKPAASSTTTDAAATDPGEDAYSEGFRLWEAGKYNEAIASLRAFTAAFPTHRRVSWANNLTGRAMLDKGDARGAAQVLLANYEANPNGGRAQDSLYYLGKALMKIGQPAEACKAYAELTSVYGDKVRSELKALLPAALAEANCS